MCVKNSTVQILILDLKFTHCVSNKAVRDIHKKPAVTVTPTEKKNPTTKTATNVIMHSIKKTR